MKKKGISLIVLVITIVVIIILAAAVILTLGQNNPINNSKVATISQTKDSLESGMMIYISNAQAKTLGELSTEKILTDSEYKVVTDDAPISITKDGVSTSLWKINTSTSKDKLSVEVKNEGNGVWYTDKYGKVYLIFANMESIPAYLKDGENILSSVSNFVVYKDIEFSENTQQEPAENITASIVITKNSNSTATISGFSRNGIKSITYTGPRQGTITPTMNGNYYTAVANVGNGDYTFTVTDNNDESLTKEETISGITAYSVSSVEDLCKFRDYVNMGDDFAGVTVTQTTDLDLSSVCGEEIGSWIPIGNVYAYFSGTYDGTNHLVNNIYINKPEENDKGFFGAIKSGKVSNLTLEGTITGEMSIGGICGYCRGVNTEFYNCKNYVDINSSKYSSGGIIGSIGNETVEATNGIRIISCKNYADINSGKFHVGGIVGIIVNSLNIVIENCGNYGNCTVNESHLGGIVGTIQHNTNLLVNSCSNYGTHLSKEYCSGGIIGTIAEGGIVSIQNCYNTNTISTNLGSQGGIVGNLASYNSNYSNPSLTITNCYNYGSVSTIGAYGGILGWTGNPGWYTLTNNYWEIGKGASYGVGTGSSNVGATGVSSNTLKGYASILGDAYKEDTNNKNDGYPILSWE